MESVGQFTHFLFDAGIFKTARIDTDAIETQCIGSSYGG
jgi:hypothetical protein